MEIRIAELKDSLYGSINPVMQANGFKIKKNFDLYEKKIEDFKYIFKFLFHVQSGDIAIEILALIYYVPAETIYKAATGLSVKTIGNEIGALANNPDGNITNPFSDILSISKKSDIDLVVKRVLEMFSSVALPFYQRFNTISDLDSVLNDNPTKISVYANAEYFRCPNGLIVAKLAKRKNYDDLQKIYDERMSTVSEMFKERYDKVKELLSHR